MIKTAGAHQQSSREGPRPSKLAVNLSYKGRQVPQLALVDTGNLIARYGGCAISEQLAQHLNIPISPEGPKIGTADKNSYLNVIGRCRGLRVTIPATGRQLILNPVVIRGFSIGLNLGLKFLMKPHLPHYIEAPDKSLDRSNPIFDRFSTGRGCTGNGIEPVEDNYCIRTKMAPKFSFTFIDSSYGIEEEGGVGK